MTRTTKLLEHLGKALLLHEGAEWTDGQLLGRFIEQRDEAAFAALVRRHGPMVWGVCRRLLNHHDAEDAFQAAFVVLLRKAAAVSPREMVGNWLYGVAHQTALFARRTAARRRHRERQVTEMPEPQAVPPTPLQDLQPLLDQELSRLPDKYRAVVVLCDLEAKTRKEAARQLGVPEGTVAGRLARARALLARQLARHGLPLSGAAMAALLAQSAASASVPAGVVAETINTGCLWAVGKAASAGVIPAKVAALAEGVLKTMFLTKRLTLSAVLLVTALLGGGLALGLAQERIGPAAPSPAPSSSAGPDKGDDVPKPKNDAEEEFKALVKEYDEGEQNVFRRDKYEKRALELAQMNPKESFAVDALLWILRRGWQPNGGILLATTAPFGPASRKALELLARDYAADKRVGRQAEFLLLAPPEADPFLRALMEKNPDREVQARACLALASRGQWYAEQARFQSAALPPAATEEERKDRERKMVKLKEEEEQQYQEAEKYFELTATKYGELLYFDQWTFGEIAKHALFEVKQLRIGKTAPEIEGEDLSGKKLKLSDYRSKVVLLDFYWWGNAPNQTIQPFERSLMKTYANRPFTILGINRDRDREALMKTRAEEKITWPSWFDAGGVPGPASTRWLDSGTPPGPIALRWNARWPTLYLLDHQGIIRGKGGRFEEMEKLVDPLVREAEAAAK
jgi:RNA polymerase sigma factor (sigma-70 family)